MHGRERTARRILVLLVIFVITAMSGTAAADTITLGITYLPPEQCGQVWDWSGCPSVLVPTVFGDPTVPGYCFFTQPYGKIRMYPARLEISTSMLAGIESVEIDFNEIDGVGSTRGYAYAVDETPARTSKYSTAVGATRITLDVTGFRVGKIALACDECEVTQVRLRSAGSIVATASEGWGTIKALYRD